MVLDVDDVGIRCACPLDVSSGLNRSLKIDRGGQDGDFLRVVRAKILPDRQLIAASSPRGPHKKNQLAAVEVTEVNRFPVEAR